MAADPLSDRFCSSLPSRPISWTWTTLVLCFSARFATAAAAASGACYQWRYILFYACFTALDISMRQLWRRRGRRERRAPRDCCWTQIDCGRRNPIWMRRLMHTGGPGALWESRRRRELLTIDRRRGSAALARPHLARFRTCIRTCIRTWKSPCERRAIAGNRR